MKKILLIERPYTAGLAVNLERGLEMDKFELVADFLLLLFSASEKRNNVTKEQK